MIVAKFRVLQINQFFQSKPPTQRVEMRPVMAKSACYPDASEENARFWDSTPSGEAEIEVEFGSDELEGGACYYIHMRPDPEGDWKLELKEWSENQLGVRLSLGWRHYVAMSISNKGAWPAFLDAGPGSKWTVTFEKAPSAGENEPY